MDINPFINVKVNIERAKGYGSRIVKALFANNVSMINFTNAQKVRTQQKTSKLIKPFNKYKTTGRKII